MTTFMFSIQFATTSERFNLFYIEKTKQNHVLPTSLKYIIKTLLSVDRHLPIIHVGLPCAYKVLNPETATTDTDIT